VKHAVNALHRGAFLDATPCSTQPRNGDMQRHWQRGRQRTVPWLFAVPVTSRLPSVTPSPTTTARPLLTTIHSTGTTLPRCSGAARARAQRYSRVPILAICDTEQGACTRTRVARTLHSRSAVLLHTHCSAAVLVPCFRVPTSLAVLLVGRSVYSEPDALRSSRKFCWKLAPKCAGIARFARNQRGTAPGVRVVTLPIVLSPPYAGTLLGTPHGAGMASEAYAYVECTVIAHAGLTRIGVRRSRTLCMPAAFTSRHAVPQDGLVAAAERARVGGATGICA